MPLTEDIKRRIVEAHGLNPSEYSYDEDSNTLNLIQASSSQPTEQQATANIAKDIVAVASDPVGAISKAINPITAVGVLEKTIPSEYIVFHLLFGEGTG